MTTAEKQKDIHPSPEAERIIAEGLRNGRTPHKIQKDIRERLEEKVCLRDIRQRKDKYEKNIDTKKTFKKKGADIVRKFLEGVKDSGDVSDLQAVLEQAVYFDCLRRYAADENGFLKEINARDLLKITHDYQKTRLRSLSASRNSGNSKFPFSPVHAIELLGMFEESLSDEPELKEAFARRKPALMKKVKPFFDTAEFEAASEDHEAIQKIREKYELSKKGSNGRATA